MELTKCLPIYTAVRRKESARDNILTGSNFDCAVQKNIFIFTQLLKTKLDESIIKSSNENTHITHKHTSL